MYGQLSDKDACPHIGSFFLTVDRSTDIPSDQNRTVNGFSPNSSSPGSGFPSSAPPNACTFHPYLYQYVDGLTADLRTITGPLVRPHRYEDRGWILKIPSLVCWFA